MRIRVEGTRAEVDTATALIADVLEVQEVSSFYANTRTASVLGRVYLTVASPTTTVVRAREDRLGKGTQITSTPGKEITP
ncbi:hypothetical protein [Umezawaea sp. NPDC059074]|uniref:hypothetical protein n=1 Tax=Umezawaea sp. NPDC059074 TaxID=3346716 RepID=UPI0036C6E378